MHFPSSHSSIVAAVEALIPTPADCEVRSLIKVLKNKQRGMRNAGVVLLHDNVRPHADRRLTHVLQEFSWEVFNHPPYSPDFALSDFHIFLHLKKFLFGETQRFKNDRGEDGCHIVFQTQTADFCDTGYKSWSYGMTNVSILNMNMLKNISIHAVCVPVNLSVKLGLVSVNRPRETYFLGALWEHKKVGKWYLIRPAFLKVCSPEPWGSVRNSWGFRPIPGVKLFTFSSL